MSIESGVAGVVVKYYSGMMLPLLLPSGVAVGEINKNNVYGQPVQLHVIQIVWYRMLLCVIIF